MEGLKHKEKYRVEFMDTSGDIKYKFMLKDTYKRATTFVLVLAVDDRKSLESLDQWRDKL